jgi:hypothetical protein
MGTKQSEFPPLNCLKRGNRKLTWPEIAAGNRRSLEKVLSDEEGIGVAFGAYGGGGTVAGVDDGGVG